MTPTDMDHRLRENVGRVRAQIAAACDRVGRSPESVHVVCVTKYVGLDVLRLLPSLGLCDLGESRVQQLESRAREFGELRLDWPGDCPPQEPSPRWHMIGHLQRNKVKLLLPACRVVHSLDSDRLALEIQQQAEALKTRVNVFLEVNIAGESSKEGASIRSVTALAELVARQPCLHLRGLMTMAPLDPDPEAARPYFAGLRELLADLRRHGAVGPDCCHLSMGMSQDFEVAVEEGATFVRIGSALFAGLPSTDPRG